MERAFRWLRDAAVTAALLVQQAALSLLHNWGMAVLAIVLAVSLWVYVTDREEQERTGRVPGSVPVECVNIPPGKADSPPCGAKSVTVRVRAPEDVLDRLLADDFRATADLADVTGDQPSVRVRVESQVARAEVVEVSPAQITVRLEDVTSRSVLVRTKLVGAPPRGFDAQELPLEPDEAVVSGPESLVARVAAVEADVDLTGVRTNFQQTLLLHARDDQGGDIQGVNVEPESAVVRFQMAQL